MPNLKKYYKNVAELVSVNKKNGGPIIFQDVPLVDLATCVELVPNSRTYSD